MKRPTSEQQQYVIEETDAVATLFCELGYEVRTYVFENDGYGSVHTVWEGAKEAGRGKQVFIIDYKHDEVEGTRTMELQSRQGDYTVRTGLFRVQSVEQVRFLLESWEVLIVAREAVSSLVEKAAYPGRDHRPKPIAYLTRSAHRQVAEPASPAASSEDAVAPLAVDEAANALPAISPIVEETPE
ncbi:hypothetical protein F1C16_03005 [Hymenobacter sp. NBH84]|uniref:hypothetical protein n=1 Tax=Hymenobacter sp. NBH84 TaxID=2596915 RepID=UPI00162AEB82|nr:hypothetical protein [Hymenobacter sp. NBH84]QNE38592.1 hypothetical protein F1C16_03005 [Hymenobacter sp. NBH84]